MEKFLMILLIFEIITFAIALAFALVLFAKVLYDMISPEIFYIINKRKREKKNKEKMTELQKEYADILCTIETAYQFNLDNDEFIDNLYLQLKNIEDKIERLKE